MDTEETRVRFGRIDLRVEVVEDWLELMRQRFPKQLGDALREVIMEQNGDRQ